MVKCSICGDIHTWVTRCPDCFRLICKRCFNWVFSLCVDCTTERYKIYYLDPKKEYDGVLINA